MRESSDGKIAKSMLQSKIKVFFFGENNWFTIAHILKFELIRYQSREIANHSNPMIIED